MGSLKGKSSAWCAGNRMHVLGSSMVFPFWKIAHIDMKRLAVLKCSVPSLRNKIRYPKYPIWCLYSGRKKPWPVQVIHLRIMVVNLQQEYQMKFPAEWWGLAYRKHKMLRKIHMHMWWIHSHVSAKVCRKPVPAVQDYVTFMAYDWCEQNFLQPITFFLAKFQLK